MGGWVKLHRKLLYWEWYSDINTKCLFFHLLIKANHKSNNWKGIPIEPGQLVTGRKVLAKETGLSEQQVRTALLKLKSTNEITIKTTSQYSIITLVKWSDYQAEQPAECPTSNQRATTNKNDKNEKKNICPSTFEDFWEAYPRQLGKGQALTQYNRLMKNGIKLTELMQGVEGYKKYISASKMEAKFIKYPANWLKNEGWKDDYDSNSFASKSSIKEQFGNTIF